MSPDAPSGRASAATADLAPPLSGDRGFDVARVRSGPFRTMPPDEPGAKVV